MSSSNLRLFTALSNTDNVIHPLAVGRSARDWNGGWRDPERTRKELEGQAGGLKPVRAYGGLRQGGAESGVPARLILAARLLRQAGFLPDPAQIWPGLREAPG